MAADKNQIVTHARFGLTPERMEELENLGVDVRSVVSPSEFTLPAPEPGLPCIGTLTDDEAFMFRAVYQLANRMDEIQRKGMGAALREMGDMLERSQSLDSDPSPSAFAKNEDLKHEYFGVRQQWKYVHALFHWTVGERLDQHQKRLGVRAGLKVVVLGDRVD